MWWFELSLSVHVNKYILKWTEVFWCLQPEHKLKFLVTLLIRCNNTDFPTICRQNDHLFLNRDILCFWLVCVNIVGGNTNDTEHVIVAQRGSVSVLVCSNIKVYPNKIQYLMSMSTYMWKLLLFESRINKQTKTQQ